MAIDRDGEGPPLRRDDARRDNPRDGGGDLRAPPFTDEMFGDERRGSGGRSWSLVIGIALGVVLIGGVGWYAFKGNGVSLAPGEVQAVKADPAPYKMKPDNPGGMQVDNQDKLVYDRVAKGSAPNRVENLLPPPEEPKAPPLKPQTEAQQQAPAAPALAQSAPAAKPAPDTAAPNKAAPDEKQLQAMIKQADEPRAVAPPKTSAPDPLAAAVAAATGGKTEAALTPDSSGPAKTTPPPAQTTPTQTAMATPAATPSSSVASGAGVFQIQLASVPSEDAANAEWRRISGRHKDLFAALSPAVSKADLGDKGIYYRLRAGPLADKAAADDLCSALAADKIGCIVVKP